MLSGLLYASCKMQGRLFGIYLVQLGPYVKRILCPLAARTKWGVVSTDCIAIFSNPCFRSMTRHGKNCTASAVYSYHERRRDAKTSGYGTLHARLGADSIKEFDCCSLTLQPCR